MLELILTRTTTTARRCREGAPVPVLDELHTYRGRQVPTLPSSCVASDRVAAPDPVCRNVRNLASGGSQDEQRAEVARVASLFFGSDVSLESIIGETLQRTTPGRDITDAKFVDELRARVADADRRPPGEFDAFRADPLSIWLESTFGVTTEAGSGRLIRVRTPRSITGKSGAAVELSALTGLDVSRCAEAIEDGLLAGYGSRHPETGFPAFAFRLHQFISRGDTVYARWKTKPIAPSQSSVSSSCLTATDARAPACRLSRVRAGVLLRPRTARFVGKYHHEGRISAIASRTNRGSGFLREHGGALA
jgi:hypothetical protein